jgi:hypothetical protein
VDGTRDISISPQPPSATAAQDNRLPPELLAAIFVHLSKQKLPLPGCKDSYFVRDLVSVTHVCRFWRQAAINAPELWTEITIRNAEAIKAFLERSGELPLNVDLRLGSGDAVETDHDILDALVPHTHRFRQLSVYVPRGPSYKTSIPFTKPAPLLEKFVINHLEGQGFLLFNDQAPRLRELVMVSKGLWLQNQLGSLTSLHLTISQKRRTHSEFLLFFDMLRRCPVLEEMSILWFGQDVQLVPPQLPTVPLHRLRKLLLKCPRLNNLRYFLQIFDLKADGIVINLSEVVPPHKDDPICCIWAMFPNDRSSRLSLASSTGLVLIVRTGSPTIIIHAIGPGFSIRIGLCPDGSIPLGTVKCVFRHAFPSVRELLIRGPSRTDIELYGVEHFTALEKLGLTGSGSKLARNLRKALSPDPSGVLPCPLLSIIDCYWGRPGVYEITRLARIRSRAGRQLQKLRVLTSFIPLPACIASCVGDVGSLDMVHFYTMGLS